MPNARSTQHMLALSLIGALLLLGYQAIAAPRIVQIEPAVIATINLEKVFDQIKQGPEAEKRLTAVETQLAMQIKNLEEEVELLEEELDAFPPGGDAYNRAQRAWMEAAYKTDGYKQFANRKMELENADALKRVYTQIRDACEQLARQHGYHIISLDDTVVELNAMTQEEMARQISGRRTIYVDSAIDITDQLIAFMNQM